MNFHKAIVGTGVLALMGAAWYSYRWAGVALVGSAAVMWILLHFTRSLQVLKRATNRPIGSVSSAVMLNAKLRKGVSLLHVIAMTKSLGLEQSAKDAQPEVFRWKDAGESYVTCEFRAGKLTTWSLVRPQAADDVPADTAVTAP